MARAPALVVEERWPGGSLGALLERGLPLLCARWIRFDSTSRSRWTDGSGRPVLLPLASDAWWAGALAAGRRHFSERGPVVLQQRSYLPGEIADRWLVESLHFLHACWQLGGGPVPLVQRVIRSDGQVTVVASAGEGDLATLSIVGGSREERRLEAAEKRHVHSTPKTYLELLKLFARGTWSDYKSRAAQLPALSEAQASTAASAVSDSGMTPATCGCLKAAASSICPSSDILGAAEIILRAPASRRCCRA